MEEERKKVLGNKNTRGTSQIDYSSGYISKLDTYISDSNVYIIE